MIHIRVPSLNKMFINQLRQAIAYVWATELCISLDKIWCVSWNIIAMMDLSVLDK